MKKKLFLLCFFILSIISLDNVYGAVATPDTKVDESRIRWYSCTVVDYDTDAYNAYERGYSSSDFNNLPADQKQRIDEKLFLFGSAGIKFGGYQNERINANNVRVTSGATQGIASNNMQNNSLKVNYSNKLPFFPTASEANGLTGNGKPYKEVLRDWKFPFYLEGDGWYVLDSNNFTVNRNYAEKKFDLYNGSHLGMAGLFLFNDLTDSLVENGAPTVYTYGLRIDIPFYMTSDGKAVKADGTKEDMVFNFSGDDDVWVYVDGELKLDIGGGHGAIAGYINFARNQSYVQNVWDLNNITQDKKNVYKENIFGDKLLEEGKHTLTIFYFERCEGASNFYARFNLQSGATIQYVDKYSGEVLSTEYKTGPIGMSFTTSSKNIAGYTLVQKPSTESYTLTENEQTITYYYAKNAKVTASYINDITGEKLITDVVNTYKQGDSYTTEEKSFDGYKLVSKSTNTSGQVGRENINVEYRYKKITSVEVKYIDQVTRKEIIDKVTKIGLEKDPYETEAKNIEGYELVLTPSNAKGEMTVEKITVTYEYRKLSDVTVKYVNEITGKEIEGVDQVVTTYKQGESYTTEKKQIAGYTYTRDTQNTSGTVEDKDIEVVYYYKKISSGVEVKYIDQVTGKEIADTVTKTGLEKDPYETEAKNVEGYELVLTPSNAKGEMTVEKITVTYEYRKLSDVTVKYVDENTGEEIEGADQVVTTYKQGESYTTEKKQIAGYTYTRDTQNTAGTVEDKDIEVVYYYKKNTSVTVRYLDVKTNEPLEEDIVINGLEADDYDTEQKTFEGYKYVSVDGNTSGKMEREPITITYYYIKQSNVVTKYVDKVTGEEITDKIEVTYSEGDNYTTVRKTIEGYTCVEDSKNITGVVGRENIEVTYYYKKNTGVTVKYIDMYENIEISGTESKTGLEGDEYTTEQKEIPGYRFVEVVGEPSGQMSREPVEIVYKYVKQTKVTVYHKDENTNEILIAEMPVDYDEKAEYTTKEKEIKGYTKTGDSGNTAGVVGRENIEVTYYYKKNTKVTVKYIDMVTGEKIGEEEVIEGLERDEYETVKKEIEGYEWVETEGKASGQMEKNPTEVIYKYKKVSKLITEHIDANTNEKIIENIEKEYKEGERYEALAQNLEGYVLVESPEETTGVMGRENITKTFYYKKISAGLTVKYVDKITGELLDQKEYSGNEKDVIELEEKDFKYYILSSKPDFSQVELTVEPQEVVYYYIRTSKVEIEGIDQESGEVLYQGEVSGLEGDKYETYPREIEGYELVKIPDNQNGTYKRNNEKVVYEYRKIAGKVEVKYVDDETGEIIESYEIEGKVGDSYKTERREYEGYSLVKVEGETSGVLEREEKEVIYHYERKIGKLIVKYIDEEGKEILREESEGKVGDKYKVEEKEIEGYEIVKRPENVEGEYKEGVIEVVFIVRQEVVVEPIEKGTIKVNFVDKEGNILKETYIEEGEEGKDFYMEAPEIEGYKIVGEKEIRAKFVAGQLVFDVVYEKIPEEINVDTGDIAVIAIACVAVVCVIGIVFVIVKNKKK